MEPAKTTVIEFNKSGLVDNNMDIELNGKTLANTHTTRFLVILMDNQLKFESHVDYIRGKMEKANNVLKFVSSITKGPEINTSLMLYKSLVRSVADYGCFVYASLSKVVATKLERGQYLVLRTALGLRNSIPTNVIIAESKVTYMRNRAALLAKNFCIKVRKHGPEDIKESIEELCRTETYYRHRRPLQMDGVLAKAWENVKRFSEELGKPKKGYDIWKHNYLSLTMDLNVDLEYGKQYAHIEKKAPLSRQVESLKYEEQDVKLIDGIIEKYDFKTRPLIIYTDGAKPEGSMSTGASVVCDVEDTAYYMSLPKNCSSFTAEAFAIKASLEILLQAFRNKRYKQKSVVIFSDCQGVLKTIKNNKLSVYYNPYILETRNLCWKLKILFDKEIFFTWIPSHRGFVGNEIADILAKQGSMERADNRISTPFQDLTSVFKKEEWNDTQDLLLTQARRKGINYFCNYYKRSRKKCWFHKLNTERYFCTLINRIRSNHYNLNSSLARKGYIASAQCECGYECEDIDHVIWACPKYNGQRIQLKENFAAKKLDNCNEEAISGIIQREDWNKLYSIYQYICRINKII